VNATAPPPYTATLARFAVGAAQCEFPARARAMAVDAITDCVGCILAGTGEKLVGPLLEVVAENPAAPAAMLGLGRRAAPPDAALVNGTLAHALDYDDTNHPGYAHPTAAILPALLAAASLRPTATGRDVVAGYIAGIEVVGKLGAALNTAHYKRGWHATSTFGSIAAAVAAASMLGLDEERSAVAIAVAGSSASGLRANFGTMTKPLHAGLAARNGVLAALLAQAGWTANPTALEHGAGYVAAFNGDAEVRGAPLSRWGEQLEILSEYGLALKPYPSCGATHPGIEAALLLRPEIGATPIRRVRLGVSEMAFRPLIYVDATTGLEGKFSLHYCIAAALVHGELGLASFLDERVGDTRVKALMARTTMEADDRVRHDPEFATVVALELEDGRILEKLVPLAMGKPSRWFDEARLRSKLGDCIRHAAPATPDASVDRLFAALQGLDSAKPVSGLLSLLEPRLAPAA
jgi:2-methylcitrate dehydratase PrpD